jgi:hypothetical protein
MALEIFGEHLLKGFAEHCAEDWVCNNCAFEFLKLKSYIDYSLLHGFMLYPNATVWGGIRLFSGIPTHSTI